MKTGRRIANPKDKQLAGTFRPDRHDNIESISAASTASSVPVPPSWMTAEARLIWAEELPRVIAQGAIDADSTFFARYCELSASFIALTIAGEPVKAALVTELRRSAELLGIAGVRSRLVKTDLAAPVSAASPYAPLVPSKPH